MKKVFSLILVLLMVLSIAVPGMAAGKTKTKITLNKTGTVELKLGETLQLTATVTPEAAVTWKSSKTKVAKVDKKTGLVTPKKEGTTTIIAKAGGAKAKVKVKVVDPKKPTGLTITQGKSMNAKVGIGVQLTVTFAPSGATSDLIWKSSKPKVAKVDKNGMVIPKKEGTAKITVTAKKNKKAKATIVVKVTDAAKPTKIVINAGSNAMLYVGNKMYLGLTLTPSDASYEMKYKSSNKKVASVTNYGLVEAKKAGTAKITVTSKKNKKVKASITITVKAAKNIASFDVFTLVGQNMKTVMEKYGLYLNYSADNGDGTKSFAVTDGTNLNVYGDGKSLESAKIYYLTLESKKFNAAGLTPGLDYTAAVNKMKSAGWTVTSVEAGGIVTDDGGTTITHTELVSKDKKYKLQIYKSDKGNKVGFLSCQFNY